MVLPEPYFSLATVEIRVVRLGSFQNLYLSFAIVEITHGVTANRDDTQIFVVIFSHLVIWEYYYAHHTDYFQG